MFLKQSGRWPQAKVANLKVDETHELARWFPNRYKLGSRPIFDGICSMCVALLFGTVDGHTALSNKFAGPPTYLKRWIHFDERRRCIEKFTHSFLFISATCRHCSPGRLLHVQTWSRHEPFVHRRKHKATIAQNRACPEQQCCTLLLLCGLQRPIFQNQQA